MHIFHELLKIKQYCLISFDHWSRRVTKVLLKRVAYISNHCLIHPYQLKNNFSITKINMGQV